ncbi:formate/nitrite transporter [Abditibacterium utsteinense]|uniref:Formate/nitrite transporter n=1 Tax=Abditibacterium utsteinense TaxID=1960156 RepID=A0A2S8SR71_9BACT|nr:formate/nitrite transporter family protein [Abditibacterium utsteinense]PQV63304.1 formate/nitrite transporter [Abditibacterium utsteinense]
MSYVKPETVVDNMILGGAAKGNLSLKDLLIRGALSGALLGIATTLAFSTALQTGAPIAGALLFPVGFVMIVLLGLELVTGNFALLPVAAADGKINVAQVLKNWAWVFIGNLIGSLLYAALFSLTAPKPDMVEQIVKVALAKTVGYEKMGSMGMVTLFVRAMLCNWMVTLGVVMAMTSQSTSGKVLAMWLPILTFFAQGFEHSVVNMFVIPAGMMLGAPISMSQWWLGNQIPVTLGNIVGGLLFTGMALYATHHKKSAVTSATAPVSSESSRPASPLAA